MHHADVGAGEATKPCGVEVERVEEANVGPAGNPVPLDRQPPALELAYKPTYELVPATGGRRLVLVEDREVGSAGSRGRPVERGANGTGDSEHSGTRMDNRGPRLGAERHR
jgi:hypothetical protein